MNVSIQTALATLKPQAGITAGSYAAPVAPQPVSTPIVWFGVIPLIFLIYLT